ncbi:MAG: protein kinase [Myxococcales bacterium]|nr:protein kinase [Myxococcales bacterium]
METGEAAAGRIAYEDAPTEAPAASISATDETIAADVSGALDVADTLAARGDARRSDPDAPLQLGELVGRLVILSQLGKGGMGVVYAAHDPELDRKVALKMILADRGRDADARARLQREARALARLAHPNVVTVLDVGEHHGQLWISMEFVQGRTLSTWLKEQQRTWREVLAVFKPAARGVAAVHAAGLLHRDLKPDNIMVGDDGRVRVMDFGLVRRDGEPGGQAPAEPARDRGRVAVDAGADALSTELTRLGSLLGTPAYMAPEQYSGDPVDVRTDIFSLCATLWTALYGQRPFAGATIAALHDAVLTGRVETPADDRRVPTWLRRAALKGLAAAPDERYASVEELLAALAADPTRRRWIAGGVLSVGLVAAALYGEGQLERERALASCAREGARIEAVWNQAARVELRERAAATGVSFAETVVDKAAPLLDDYAREWEQARVSVCRDVTVEEVWSEELGSLAVACLDERRVHLETLLSTLRSLGAGDEGVRALEGVVGAVSELPRLDDCLAEHRLRARPKLPQTDGASREVGRLRGLLTKAATLRALRRHDESLGIIAQVDADAEALGWAPLQAAASLERGLVLDARGRHDDAATPLTAAYLRAGAAGADELSIAAATALISATGRGDGGLQAARHWSELAVMALDREGADALDLRRAQALHNLGVILGERGEPGEQARALELLGRALEIRRRTLGDDHPSVAALLETIGTLHAEQGADEQALEHFERALALHESALGIEAAPGERASAPSPAASPGDDRALVATRASPEVGTLLADIGDVYLERGDPRALEVLERAEEIYEQTLAPDDPRRGVVLNRLGLALHERGEQARAETYFRNARARALAPAARARVHLGGVRSPRSTKAQGRRVDALRLAEQVQRASTARLVAPAARRGELRARARVERRGQRSLTARARSSWRPAPGQLHDAGPRAIGQRRAIARWLAEHGGDPLLAPSARDEGAPPVE